MLASQWIARTLAVTLVMTAPGLAGSYLDRQLGTSIFALLGFGLGLLLGTTGLLVLARHLTPTARGPTPPPDGDSARPRHRTRTMVAELNSARIVGLLAWLPPACPLL